MPLSRAELEIVSFYNRAQRCLLERDGGKLSADDVNRLQNRMRRFFERAAGNRHIELSKKHGATIVNDHVNGEWIAQERVAAMVEKAVEKHYEIHWCATLIARLEAAQVQQVAAAAPLPTHLSSHEAFSTGIGPAPDSIRQGIVEGLSREEAGFDAKENDDGADGENMLDTSERHANRTRVTRPTSPRRRLLRRRSRPRRGHHPCRLWCRLPKQ